MNMIPVSKAVELHGIATKRTLTRWLVHGVIPGRKLAGRWFVEPEAIRKFLDGARTTQSTPTATRNRQ